MMVQVNGLFGRVEAEESNGGEGHEIGARAMLKKHSTDLAVLHLLHFVEPIHSTVDSIGDKRQRRVQWQKEMSLFTRTKHRNIHGQIRLSS